ncbi:MAG TPA: hypothetical protein VHS06_00145, partial [Chloroflexota bacterium]|nr:hypothetical protein [Chloroflexota bacterium]
LELGITRYFEVALFQGFSPVESVLAFELGLVTKKPVLVSAGMLGLQNGAKAQPFLEGGYYRGKTILIAGVQGQNSAVYGIFGAAYQATQRLLLAADYISGSPNFATLGVTYAITPNLSLNPAVYISNSTPHHAYGYAVLTWNVKAW